MTGTGDSDALASPQGMKERLTAAASVENAAGHKNMLQLIQLRWIAVVGQITTVSVATVGLDVRLPLPQMIAVLACLIAFNIGSQLRWHERRTVANGELFFAVLIDVASLTAQLYFSGGMSNPFVYLYLLQVILSAVLLEVWTAWIVVVITGLCLVGLARYSLPLDLALKQELEFFSLYVQGTLICFLLNASLLVFFISRINSNLRAGDAQLAALRQRAVEEEHIVRMGLLATGAAHELGTPLATLSVILGDWRRMPEFSRNRDLLDEITEMQIQLQRCKSIVSGILLSAGEARGESSTRTTINAFLDGLAREWRTTRAVTEFVYCNNIVQDMPVAFDSTLKQTIFNVLDNALEASPQWVRLEASHEADYLKLRVTDAGPGFTAEMLAQLGKPYQSSKGRPGGGLGLFLVVNVIRKLGGTVSARNRTEGGACVELTLPVASVTVPEDNGNDD